MVRYHLENGNHSMVSMSSDPPGVIMVVFAWGDTPGFFGMNRRR